MADMENEETPVEISGEQSEEALAALGEWVSGGERITQEPAKKPEKKEEVVTEEVTTEETEETTEETTEQTEETEEEPTTESRKESRFKELTSERDKAKEEAAELKKQLQLAEFHSNLVTTREGQDWVRNHPQGQAYNRQNGFKFYMPKQAKPLEEMTPEELDVEANRRADLIAQQRTQRQDVEIYVSSEFQKLKTQYKDLDENSDEGKSVISLMGQGFKAKNALAAVSPERLEAAVTATKREAGSAAAAAPTTRGSGKTVSQGKKKASRIPAELEARAMAGDEDAGFQATGIAIDNWMSDTFGGKG